MCLSNVFVQHIYVERTHTHQLTKDAYTKILVLFVVQTIITSQPWVSWHRTYYVPAYDWLRLPYPEYRG